MLTAHVLIRSNTKFGQGVENMAMWANRKYRVHLCSVIYSSTCLQRTPNFSDRPSASMLVWEDINRQHSRDSMRATTKKLSISGKYRQWYRNVVRRQWIATNVKPEGFMDVLNVVG